MIKIDIKIPSESELKPPFLLKKSIHSEINFLIIYDLYNCLSNGLLIPKNLPKGNIIDIYLLESILFLGLFHKKNFPEKLPLYGIRKLIEQKCIRQGDLTHFSQLIVEYALLLKEQAITNDIFNHYLEKEIEFAFGLFEVTAEGISIDSRKIDSIQNNIHLAKRKIYAGLEKNRVTGINIRALTEWAKGYGYDEYFFRGNLEITLNDISLLEDKHQVFKLFKRFGKIHRIEKFISNLANKNKIYPEYKTMGTVTGRCTSRKPNIMGVPKIFRPIVIPKNNYYGIVECDYSQMEPGIIAALSNDKNLLTDFNNGDVYSSVGMWLFGQSDESYRPKAKSLFLGILYGMSVKVISKHLEMTGSQVKSILEKFYGRYAGVAQYLKNLEIVGLQNGYAQNIFGLKRYRYNKTIRPNYWEKNWFKNFPVQSTAATIFKNAIIKISHQFREKSFNLLVPLYDSIVFEAPKLELHETTDQVVRIMTLSMTEFFPMLKPRISTAEKNPSCWNHDGNADSIEEFLSDPLHGIDIYERQTGNVDWTRYL